MLIDFRERGSEGEGEKHRWDASLMHLNPGQNCNLGMCPDQESNPQPFGL